MDAAKDFEDKLIDKKLDQIKAPNFERPINKVSNDDWRNQKDAKNFVKKLNQEKRDREKLRI